MTKHLALATLIALSSIAQPASAQASGKFGTDVSSQYQRRARQIVQNGQNIRDKPAKQQFLYDNLEAKLKKKYKRPRIPRLFGFVDDNKEADLLAVFLQANDRIRKRTGGRYQLPDSFVFAAINNEGRIFQQYSNIGQVTGGNGFMMAGLDVFGAEFKDIQGAGMLKPSFSGKFTSSFQYNEQGHYVKSANFKSIDSIFEAFAASLTYRQHRFQKDCKRFGINYDKLPQEEKLFWTYFYFNGGESRGRRVVRKNASNAKLRRFYQRRNVNGIPGNSFVVLGSTEWMQKSGLFDQSPNGKYWWSGGNGVPAVKDGGGDLGSADVGNGSNSDSGLFKYVNRKDGQSVFRYVVQSGGSASAVARRFNSWDQEYHSNKCGIVDFRNVKSVSGQQINQVLKPKQRVYVKVRCK